MIILPPPLRIASVVPLFALALVGACGGRSPSELAPHDITTVFFISKSDDHNRVDYGMRLDHDCVPPPNAVFPYWHEFEPKERTHALGTFEGRAYGLDTQRLVAQSGSGGEYVIKLKPFDRPIAISTRKQPDGRCVAIAHIKIDGVEGAEFFDAFAQLGGLLSVEYIELHGRDPKTGTRITGRIKP
jgi:hypothetical protein